MTRNKSLSLVTESAIREPGITIGLRMPCAPARCMWDEESFPVLGSGERPPCYVVGRGRGGGYSAPRGRLCWALGIPT
ncbi:hypothetical protein Ddc_11535 [Ditylenchus destructor]|nr:hypothetical protein Ddc_11535 [Ditylenchus destructor]